MPRNDKRLITCIVLILGITLLPATVFAGSASTSVFRFQQKMADKGIPQAQYKLGMMYETGVAVERNLIKAKLWYGRAAYQNYKPAQHRLTYLDVKQNGFTPAHEQWVRDLKQDASFGNGEALMLLGQMYADGIGLQTNLDKSLELLRKAVGANVPGSETELARVDTMYAVQQKQRLAEQQAVQLKQQQLDEQKRAQQAEQQRWQEQRQRRLEQERRQREQQLIAERRHQQQLAIRQAELEKQKKLASQRALEAALREPMLVTETDTSDICSGHNRFSATCR